MSKQIQLKNGDEKVFPNPFFPIGSIYMSVNSTDPTTFFGGTWERFGKGRTIIGVDENDSDFNTPEKIGGSKTHRHNWRIGLHWYYGATYGESNGSGTGAYRYSDGQYDGWARDLASITTNVNAGGATSGTSKTADGKWSLGDTDLSNGMPPYITCYIWKRTA